MSARTPSSTFPRTSLAGSSSGSCGEQADGRARSQLGDAARRLLEPGHDPQQRRLARRRSGRSRRSSPRAGTRARCSRAPAGRGRRTCRPGTSCRRSRCSSQDVGRASGRGEVRPRGGAREYGRALPGAAGPIPSGAADRPGRAYTGTMDVIVGHGNTDFDAFASMLACRRLYPGAVVVLLGVAQPQRAGVLPAARGRARPRRGPAARPRRGHGAWSSSRPPTRPGSASSSTVAVAPGVEVVLFDHHAGEPPAWVPAENVVLSEDGALTTTLVGDPRRARARRSRRSRRPCSRSASTRTRAR